MKAIIATKYGIPDVLQVKELTKPVPKKNEVLIRICGAVVSATDPVMRKGVPFISRIFSGLFKPKNAIPGDALAGEIEQVGEDVKSFKKGDQVYGAASITMGAHAEYICLPEDGALAIKPTNMNYEEAAAICDGALTALPFLRDNAEIKSGQQILINGASGSIGTFAVQIAKYYGAEVTGVCSTSNLGLVKSLGADKVIDYTKEHFTKNDQNYDIIFDAVGKSSFSSCKKSLKKQGIYLTTVPTLSGMFQWMWTSKFSSKKAIFAATGLRKSFEKAKDLVFLKELIEAGKIRTVIDRRYSLSNIAEAHSYVEKGHKKGNVVLSLEEDNIQSLLFV